MKLRLAGLETWKSLLHLWKSLQPSLNGSIATAISKLHQVITNAEQAQVDPAPLQAQPTQVSTKNWSKSKERAAMLQNAQPIKARQNGKQGTQSKHTVYIIPA